jgi:long-chain acyl-CoA synthetase
MTTRHIRLVHEGLLAAAETSATKIALVVDGSPHTYGELLEASRRLAAALQDKGVQRGDRVGISMENDWPCVVSIYATLLAGAVFVLINPQTKSDKLGFLLRDSGARVLIVNGPRTKELEALETPHLRHIIRAGPPVAASELDTFETIVSSAVEPDAGATSIPLDLAALIYTSGSTGQPKGVMQTHQSMMFTIESLIEYLRLSDGDKILCLSPLSFDYGLYQLLISVALGATLVLERSFTLPAPLYERIRQLGITVFPGVPTTFAVLLAIHRHSPLRFPSVTRVTNTAAALPDEFLPGIHEIFPNALIYKMYGLTECKRVSYLEPELLDEKPGSVGRAIPGTEVYLLSVDGTPTPVGEIGVLHVRGPHVMRGYWNRPDLTAEMLKPGKLPDERVLCTHDLFRMDADGFLYFVSRTDEIIKTRGQKVSPAEVENALYKIPGVREAAVVGTSDPMLGEAIVAYVVRTQGETLTESEIRARCGALLESFMVPQRVVFCPDLPKTESGKINRRALRSVPPNVTLSPI